MHRDLKLGLALAVLLIGATTAFFFRAETESGGLPQLQNPERLDVEIASRDVIPYLGEPESDPAAEDAVSPWTKPAFLGGGTAAIRRTSVTPDPIRILMDDDVEAVDPGPGPELITTPIQPAVESAAGGVHVIQSGDTLSGLAAKYLGSVARFNEIYELNRDRLSGPNDLRVGMELRIPPIESPETPAAIETVPEAGESAVASQSTEPAEPVPGPTEAADAAPAPTSEKLFVPASKAPFVPGRFRPSGTPSADAAGLTDPERE